MSNGQLRSGVFMAPFHPNEEDAGLAMQRDLELMEWLDRLGYEEAWIGEHHSSGYEFISSPELFIAAAAERTKRIRLGTGVISLPYHHPFTVAGRVVQLDLMTRGRAMFGFGPGALYMDMKMMGMEPDVTRGRLAEGLEAVMALLRGETVTKKTDWFTLDNACLGLKPYTEPYPEITVASTRTPSGARLAGRFGTGLLCIAAAETGGYNALAENWKIATETAAENNQTVTRDKLRLVAPIHIAETREKARENVKFGLEKFLKFGFTTNPGRTGADQNGVLEDPIELAKVVWGATVGTPDDAIALVERLRAKQGDFGCFLHFAHNWADWEATKKSYELYARYVVPHLRKSNAPREASLERYRTAEQDIKVARSTAVTNTFERFNAERAAQGKETLNYPGKPGAQKAS